MTFLTILLMGWLISLAFVPSRSECDLSASVSQVLEMAPAVHEQASQGQVPQTFLHRRLEVHYSPGQRVLLASSPDGVGELFTDDLVYIHAWPSGKVFRHDFRSADRIAVGSIPPQDISFLFEPGTNTLDLSTQDLTRPRFSTLPYYVLIGDCTGPTPAPSPTLMPTATPLPSPTVTSAPTWAATTTQTPAPTVTATPTPQPTAIAIPAVVPTPPLSPPLLSQLPAPFLGLGGLFILVGIFVWWWLRRVPLPIGEGELYRAGRFVTRFDLQQFGKSRLFLGSAGDILLSDNRISPVIAALYGGRSDEGERETRMDRLSPEDGTVEETIILHHGDEIALAGDYRLRYIDEVEQGISYGEEQYV